MKKFSINVDMGAKNNGVFLASIEDANANSAKITNKSAFNIKIDKGENFVLDRANRLAKRHTRRSFNRDCFVLRFAGQIFDLDKLPTRKELLEKIENQKIEYKKELKEPKELIFGLFKNRGFNYQNIKIKDEVFDDENFICLLEKFNCLKEYGYEFSECRCLEDFENFINQKADELSNSNSFKDDMLNFLNEQSKIINDIKEFYDITNNLSDKVLKNSAKAIEIAQKEINALGNDDENLANLQTKLENLQKNYPKFVEILKDKDKTLTLKFVKFFNELINAAKSELERNNKHRKAYLKDINKELNSSDNKILAWEYDEIFNNLRDKVEGKKWSKDEFYKFVGNVANIQTRVWRRYFNFVNYKMPNFDKDKLKIYDDGKLAKQILRNFRDFRYEKKHEKDTFEKIKPIMQNLMKELKSKKEQKSVLALTFLKSTDPVLTIPPYESRINKNPRACNAMSIKPESKIITPNLTNITKKIFASDEFGFLLIDENGEITTPDFNDKKITAKYLQRFLDISKSKLNDSDLYPRNLIKDNAKIEIFKRFLSDDEIKEFLKFSKAYYDEVDSAKKGVLKGDILKVCGLHTPHKHKNKAELISALFIKNHGQISSEEFDKLCDFMQNTGKYKSKAKNTKPRKIAKFFEDLDEVRKSYQNAFFNEALNTLKALNENNDKNLDANLRKIVQDYEIIAKSIQENIKFCKFQTPFEASNLATNLNYLLQLGDIIFSDKNAGFLKTCKEHTMENLLRSGGEAMASRLPSNSGKLINGKIEMYLDRLAYEIIKQSPKLDDFDEVEINVEMNKFAFEENAVAIGLKKGIKNDENDEKAKKAENDEKAKKTKNENDLICPYGGEVISQSNCEYDHIIARNDKGFNIVFNSTANLIPCKSSANLEKSNKIYKLDDLNKTHLKSVFGTSNQAEIKDFISKNLATIDEKTYTNFYNLSKKEQIAFRYALFLREGKDFGKAVRLLNQDKIKGYSNGTQKRFVNLLIEKIKKLSKKIPNFSVNFIDSKMLSATRTELSIMREDIRKQNIQDSHSHCIDASLVFHLVNSKLIKNSNSQREFLYDYFDEIYLSQSEIITPKNKQYLELKTNIARKRLFDDSVYSLVYEQCDNGKFIRIEDLKTLRDLGLLHTRKNGKKIQVPAGQAIDENALKKYFVSTHKVFDKIFEYFENKNIDGLKELKFLDNYLQSYKREDITKIFLTDNKNKKLKNLAKDYKKLTPNVAKFYQILKENEDKISRIENGKVKIDENAIKSLYKQTFDKGEKRKRNKTRCIYSLSMIADNSQYVIRRNGGYMGLKGDKIAAKNYLFKNKKGEFDIQSVPFYSKNVLPKKISDILTILSLPKDALLVYDFTDINLAKISPEIMPQNIAKHIAKLDFVISQAARHITRLYLRKNSFDDINFDELKDFTLSNKEFVKLYENYDKLFKSVLGTPRVEKQELSSAKILQNDSEILGFEYTASNSANFKALIKEILNETPSAK